MQIIIKITTGILAQRSIRLRNLSIGRFSSRASLYLSLLLPCVFPTKTSANETNVAPRRCSAVANAKLRELEHVYTHREFRIFYTMAGKHGLKHMADRNRNDVPDQVEDVATQMVAASHIFSNVIDLTSPLKMPRYGSVQSIDIFLLDMEKNGTAYDEVVNYRLPLDGPDGRCTLRIDLKNSLTNKNVTPAHELFHLYQYAYSMFKASWFLEGSAAWAEYALLTGGSPPESAPEFPRRRSPGFSLKGYEASRLWGRLSRMVDPAGKMNLPAELTSMTYLDGRVVINDDRLNGAGFIKAALEALDVHSAYVASREGWERYNWSESDQRSPRHDEELRRVVCRTVLSTTANESVHKYAGSSNKTCEHVLVYSDF